MLQLQTMIERITFLVKAHPKHTTEGDGYDRGQTGAARSHNPPIYIFPPLTVTPYLSASPCSVSASSTWCVAKPVCTLRVVMVGLCPASLTVPYDL